MQRMEESFLGTLEGRAGMAFPVGTRNGRRHGRVSNRRFASSLEGFTFSAKGSALPDDAPTKATFMRLQQAINSFIDRFGGATKLKVDGILGSQTLKSRNGVYSKAASMTGVSATQRNSVEDLANFALLDAALIEAATKLGGGSVQKPPKVVTDGGGSSGEEISLPADGFAAKFKKHLTKKNIAIGSALILAGLGYYRYSKRGSIF